MTATAIFFIILLISIMNKLFYKNEKDFLKEF